MLDYRWTIAGLSLDYRWTNDGLLLDYRWTIAGLSLDYRWTNGGLTQDRHQNGNDPSSDINLDIGKPLHKEICTTKKYK